AVKNSEISMICVGTPSNDNGSLDLKYVKRVCEEIGAGLREKDNYHVVVLRSTVLPGSVEGEIIPILEKTSGKKAGADFGVCMNPEFMREGSSVYDFYHPPMMVIGELDKGSGDIVEQIYANIDTPVIRTSIKVAEMIKYVNNSFHGLKICFANEIGNICKKLGIDSHQVMEIFCTDTKLNLSPYYLKPGFAFGGSCLPKDLRALLYKGQREDLRLPLLNSILDSNENQVKMGINLIKKTKKKKIGIFGFSFKPGTDDLRESPMVELIETLLGKGYKISIYDKNVSIAKIFGANKQYIEKEIPHISSLMSSSIEEVLSRSEVLVIGNNSEEFKKIPELIREDQIIIDLARIGDGKNERKSNYEGICW
ncbi:MAG: nucleotide sugar dehydrogenase, partial [Clostridia bacterium]|nr:nucleotide sugar dehydrogenase [Clostridia bacterium]